MCVCSQQPVPEKLQIRVNRISMAAYEALHYEKDQLKEACESWKADQFCPQHDQLVAVRYDIDV